MKCAICKKEVEPGSKYAPFCSERCKLLDLGNWASGNYRIPSPHEPEMEDDDPAGERNQER